MIDYDRVSTMTKLAIMEAREGKEMMRLCSYRKVDYVLTEIFKAFVAGTACYLMGLLLWFLYLWDGLNQFIVGLDVLQLLEDLGFRYAVIVGGYMLACAIISARRHTKRMGQRYTYLSYLRKLRHSYKMDYNRLKAERSRKSKSRDSKSRGQEGA